MQKNLLSGPHKFVLLACVPVASLLACLPDAPTYVNASMAVVVPTTRAVVVPVSPEGGTEAGVVAAGVRWRGRVDLTTDPQKPYFGWTASGFDARFTGTSIGVRLFTDAPNAPCQVDPCGLFFQAVLDGEVLPRVKIAPGESTLSIKSGLADGPHTLEFYRENESPYGRSQFLGITGGTLLPPPTYSGRVVEFVADSITAGWGALADVEHPASGGSVNECDFTMDTQAGYLSYAAKVSRALNADPSILALSGWGLYRGLFGDGLSNAVPREYNDSVYFMDPQPQWDFRTKAAAVVINLGTNDIALGDPGEENFTKALDDLVKMIRTKNGDPWIFPVIGTMLNGDGRSLVKRYLEGYVDAHGAEAAKLVFVDLGALDPALGTGCSYHPDVKEHQRMVDVLYPVMKAKLGW